MNRTQTIKSSMPASLVIQQLRRYSIGLSVLALLVLSGCVSFNQASSPDVIYSSNSAEARQLQVPPDLTNVSNGEQFVLPGTEGGPVARNYLLPEFSSVKYVRQGAQNWLEIAGAPEALWPRLLEFARTQKYAIEQTEPVSGVIRTQWRASGAKASGGLLKNLISDDEIFDRFVFRLERDGTSGTRLFARAQQATGDEVSNLEAPDWPSDSHNPEQVATILQRLLVFLGAEEQRAKGILNDAQASTILDEAELETTARGTRLLLHKGYIPSFAALNEALGNLNYDVNRSDAAIGRIDAQANGETVLLSLNAVHISAVQVSVTDGQGQRFPEEQERQLLSALHAQLI